MQRTNCFGIWPPGRVWWSAKSGRSAGRTTGFGDMCYVGLFSRKEPTSLDNGGKVVWGLGFDLGLPTATEDVLGTGKWTAGPSALGVYLGKKWKAGALLQQCRDYAGSDERDDVNTTNLQYLVYYSLNSTTSIGAAPNIIADWEQSGDDRFTVPVGFGINKTINIGKVPVRFVWRQCILCTGLTTYPVRAGISASTPSRQPRRHCSSGCSDCECIAQSVGIEGLRITMK